MKAQVNISLHFEWVKRKRQNLTYPDHDERHLFINMNTYSLPPNKLFHSKSKNINAILIFKKDQHNAYVVAAAITLITTAGKVRCLLKFCCWSKRCKWKQPFSRWKLPYSLLKLKKWYSEYGHTSFFSILNIWKCLIKYVNHYIHNELNWWLRIIHLCHILFKVTIFKVLDKWFYVGDIVILNNL